jgi:hypothetical protein
MRSPVHVVQYCMGEPDACYTAEVEYASAAENPKSTSFVDLPIKCCRGDSILNETHACTALILYVTRIQSTISRHVD